MTGVDAAETVDGRRRRSEQNRQKIIEAILELVQGGEVSPSAEQVAERAGVGLRSVFRHFNDMESLYREIGTRVEERIRPLVEEPFHSPDWRGRLDELINRKVRIFEEIAPFYLVGRLHGLNSGFGKADRARSIARERKALKVIWPPQLKKEKALFEGIDLLLSFDTYARLRMDQRLSIRKSKAVIQKLVDGLLLGFESP